MFPEYEAFHTIGILWNQQQQKVLSDDIEVHIVELPKLMQQWRNEQVNPWKIHLFVGYYYSQRMKMNN